MHTGRPPYVHTNPPPTNPAADPMHPPRQRSPTGPPTHFGDASKAQPRRSHASSCAHPPTHPNPARPLPHSLLHTLAFPCHPPMPYMQPLCAHPSPTPHAGTPTPWAPRPLTPTSPPPHSVHPRPTPARHATWPTPHRPATTETLAERRHPSWAACFNAAVSLLRRTCGREDGRKGAVCQ